MYCIRKVNDDYTWVGADCRRLALFEGVFGVPDGVSFNSYLLMDDKTVLFDTVDSAVRTTFRENVAHVAGRAERRTIWWSTTWSRTTPPRWPTWPGSTRIWPSCAVPPPRT